ncbi:uncharacterized protein PFLUO_LOCUS6574 [Penicillium psychrofluorescens]|uniref:uncharacterized protein n=1 Tax=Penicillium psychrofluorescens TaxID=3158075 RepID=UPI003CCCF77A
MKTVLSSQDASSTPVLDQALQNVFGNRGLVRNLNLNQEIHDDVSNMIDREPFASAASTNISRLVKRHVPDLVTFSHSVVDQMPWERESQVTLPDNQDQPVCEVKLFALIRSFVGHITTSILMGEAFAESFPGLLENLWTLDNNFVTLFVGTPRWIPSPGVSAGYAARDRLVHIMSIFSRAFTAWDDGIDPGIELRDLDDVSELVKERMRTFRKLGLSPGASGAAHLSLYWDTIEHTTKIIFWTVLHISSDPALLKDIRTEMFTHTRATRPSRRETGFPIDSPPQLTLDLEKVLKACPMLRACYYEAVRLHSAGISGRKLESDLTLSESAEEASYHMRKGERVMVPHGVYHNDPRYFSNTDQYDPLRFIVTDPESGAKRVNESVLAPFADGLYGSKGNSFNEKEILAVTAAIVSMWEIESATGDGLAVPGHKPTWGAFRPAKDVKVTLKLRV